MTETLGLPILHSLNYCHSFVFVSVFVGWHKIRLRGVYLMETTLKLKRTFLIIIFTIIYNKL